ncbi:MAG: hypothetical protein ABSG70_13325 [Terriglobales bacterium]|jgi:hypothetical protein
MIRICLTSIPGTSTAGTDISEGISFPGKNFILGATGMNRWTCFIGGVAILLCGCAAQAQQAGSQGRPRSNNASNEEIRDFKRAMVLQASPDQADEFKKMVASTQAARKAAHDLAQLASKDGKPDLSQSADTLSSAVDEIQANSDHFLRMFTSVQKSELKAKLKKLEKANSEVVKENKALGGGHPPADAAQLAGIAQKLDGALGELQVRQSDIGNEMAIPDDKTSQ